MVLPAIIVFAVSLFGIIFLFALKYWEQKHQRVLFATWRAKNDVRALHVKELALAAREDMEHLLPRLIVLARWAVHEGALSFARLARSLERQSHRLADLVSHKRGFERRETRSEFLRKVSEGRELDVEDGSGHNV